MKEEKKNLIWGSVTLGVIIVSVGMMFYGYITFVKDIIGLLV